MKIKKKYFREVLPDLGFISLFAVLFVLVGFRSVLANDADPSASASPNSFQYALVGIAEFDGLSYASLIDRQTKFHLLLSSAKPQQGLTLISVGGDDSPVGPSAVIQKDGRLLRLKVVTFAGTDLPDSLVSSQPATSTSDQVAILPPPGSERSPSLRPPPGAALPLVFQKVDLQKLNLSPDQHQAIEQLRRDFLSTINGTSQGKGAPASNYSTASNPATASPLPATNNDSASTSSPSSPVANSAPTPNPTTAAAQNAPVSSTQQQLKNWQSAQADSDEQLRTTLGWQAYSDYEMSLLK